MGRLGEALAAQALRERGARIVARRLRTPAGELDLVVRRAGATIGCEVKTKRAELPTSDADDPFPPGRRFGRRQRERQRRAVAWIGRASSSAARVELVEVWIAPRSGRVRVRRHARDGAWTRETDRWGRFGRWSRGGPGEPLGPWIGRA